MQPRTDAMINGGLISLGALGVTDNVLFHWLFGLHRAVPGENALQVEYAIIALAALALVLGVWRERRARNPRVSPPA